MSRAGADLRRVQAHLGHKTIAMTAQVYGHLYDDALDDVMDRLGDAFAERMTDHRRTSDGPTVVPFRRQEGEIGS